jgi:hypothetical protein
MGIKRLMTFIIHYIWESQVESVLKPIQKYNSVIFCVLNLNNTLLDVLIGGICLNAIFSQIH